MKIQEAMTTQVKSCHAGTNLAEVAATLWNYDCGALPVTDDSGRVIGMISDRDICIAVMSKNRLASEITVGEIISGNHVYDCTPEADIQDALKVMEQQQVRRLPVVDKEGKLQGIFSINDAVLAAQNKAGKEDVSFNDVMTTLKAICHHHQNTSAPNQTSKFAQA